MDKLREQRERVAEARSLADETKSPPKSMSLRGFVFAELTRGYLSQPSDDADGNYAERRERVYTFMKTPRELEKLILFGYALCMDAFLFVFTFLPIRALLALCRVISWPYYRHKRLLEPGQVHDLLRVALLLCCCWCFLKVDGSMLYHMVRGQSVIKIYVMFNILDIGDKLLASFGQDTLDALYWTATEKHTRKREHVGTLPHFVLATVYILLHATLVFFQAITLNVAINSHNQSLFTIVVSNQFVELKGSAFKKFEKNNLFQMSCSDIRERFHQAILLLVVILRNMTDVLWDFAHLKELFLPLAIVCGSEVLVDWIKHAFITKFNSISSTVYREYTLILARDVMDSKHHLPTADHCDLVSRRMGFIPLPLAVLLIRVVCNSMPASGEWSVCLLVIFFLCAHYSSFVKLLRRLYMPYSLLSFKILLGVILLGMSCSRLNTFIDHGDLRSPLRHRPQSGLPTTPFIAHQAGRTSGGYQPPPLQTVDRFTMCSNRIV